jgi:hypothetical protein
VTYCAHTADGTDGNPLPESSGKCQPLADQLPFMQARILARVLRGDIPAYLPHLFA